MSFASKGDITEWWWRTENSWEPVRRTGLVLDRSLVKTDREKVMVYKVLCSDGGVIPVREDSPVRLVSD